MSVDLLVRNNLTYYAAATSVVLTLPFGIMLCYKPSICYKLSKWFMYQALQCFHCTGKAVDHVLTLVQSSSMSP